MKTCSERKKAGTTTTAAMATTTMKRAMAIWNRRNGCCHVGLVNCQAFSINHSEGYNLQASTFDSWQYMACCMRHSSSVLANYLSYRHPVAATGVTAGEQDWTCQTIEYTRFSIFTSTRNLVISYSLENFDERLTQPVRRILPTSAPSSG